MAVPSQLAQIAFAGGIDESQRAEVLDPTTAFTTIENCRQDYRGGFTRRLGFSSLASTRVDDTTRSAGHRLASLGDSIVTIDGNMLDTWSPTNAKWSQRGRVPECSVKRRGLISVGGTQIEQYDIAYANGYYIVGYSEQITNSTDYTVNAAIIDATSGSVVHAARIVAEVFSPVNLRVVACGTNIIMVWCVDTAIHASRLDITAINSGWSTSISIRPDFTPNSFADACGMTSRLAIAYHNNTGGASQLSIATFDPTTNAIANIAATTRNTLVAALSGVSIDGIEGDTLWVAHSLSGSTDLRVRGLDPASIATDSVAVAVVSALPTSTVFRLAIGAAASTTCYVMAAYAHSTAIEFISSRSMKVYSNAGTAAVVANTTCQLFGWVAASRPFIQNSRAYAEVYYQDDIAKTAVLVDITSATGTVRPVAWIAPRLHDFFPDSAFTTRHTVAVGSTKRVGIFSIQTSSVSATLVAAEYDFASSTRWLPQPFANTLYLTGGIPYVFDGQRVSEMGFLVPPRLYSALSGVGLTGTYNYTAIYEFSDARGNVIWSSTAEVRTESPSNNTVNLYVRPLMVTWKDGTETAPLEPRNLRRIRIKIYRTLSGSSGPFYLLTTIINDIDTTTGYFSYADTTSDATLAQRAQLYTSPGVNGEALDRDAFPASLHMTECNGALVSVADDGVTLYTTAQRVIGEAPWTSDEFAVPVEEDGDITAIAAMDGTVFAFKRRAIFSVPIEQPTDNNSAGGFGTPRRLAVDLGCIDPRSVVVTSLGIFFQSERGLELLTRGQAVEPIGQMVQTTLASYPVVSAARLDTKNGLVRFSLAASEASGLVSGNGVDLVFDLSLKTWISRDTHASNTPAQSSAMVLLSGKWRYAWLSAAGTVFYEKLSSDATAFLDATSTWIPRTVETASFKLGGIQGKQHLNRVLMLSKYATAHGLSMYLAYDYNTSYQSPRSWTEAETLSLSSSMPNLQVQHDGHDESPTQSVRVKLVDSAPVTPGTGEGSTWLGLTLDITPMQGAYELPEAAA